MRKEYVVGLKKDVDYDAFWNEIENDGSGSVYVPDRSVDIVDERPLSLRSCHYSLTDEEAEKLRNDPRVQAVDLPLKQREFIKLAPCSSQTGTYSKLTGTPNSSWINWGLFRINSRTNNTNNNTGTLTYDYDVDGAGVDFIIQDSGLQCDHPDFQDANGVSRVQKINWWTAAGQTGNPPWYPDVGEAGMPVGFYTDTYGHGTHVCGVAVGKTYGRGKNSKIYVMNIDGLGTDGGIDAALSFNLITAWHNLKPVDPVTGFKRPTVVNMSWGVTTEFVNIIGGNYRGTNWAGSAKQSQYGMIGGSGNAFGYQDETLDIDVEECIDGGVILIGAAGNYYQTLAVPGGLDYNNYFRRSDYPGFDIHYMRGGTPGNTPGVLTVGAIDINYSSTGKEQKVNFSDSGPRVDVFSPGTQIVATVSNIYNPAFAQSPFGVNTYPYNSSFKIANVSGTSQATPNVAGIALQLLQIFPGETPAQIRQRIIDLSTFNVLYTTGSTTDYAVANSLHGAPNRYAFFEYNPLVTSSFIATGAIQLLNTTITT